MLGLVMVSCRALAGPRGAVHRGEWLVEDDALAEDNDV